MQSIQIEGHQVNLPLKSIQPTQFPKRFKTQRMQKASVKSSLEKQMQRSLLSQVTHLRSQDLTHKSCMIQTKNSRKSKQNSKSKGKRKESSVGLLLCAVTALNKVGCLQSYFHLLRQQLQKFKFRVQDKNNETLKSFYKILNMIVNKFSQSKESCSNNQVSDERERLSKEIEVYVHWNENLLEEIDKRMKNSKLGELLQQHQRLNNQLEMQNRILSSKAVKSFDRGQKPLQRQPQPVKGARKRLDLNLNLQGIKKQEFHDQFYSGIDKFSQSWRQQALRQKRY